MMSLLDEIARYESDVGGHWAGTVDMKLLETIATLMAPGAFSVETGCGNSTIFFSRASARHLCFTVDDRNTPPNNSVNYVLNAPVFDAGKVQFVFGPTQKTLPQYAFDQPIDAALIDGPHGYPFPDLEYYYLYQHLREGGLLVIDDINIPTIGRMFAILREDAMYDVVYVSGQSAILRRTAAPLVNPIGDEWASQRYNTTRYDYGRKLSFPARVLARIHRIMY